MDFTDFAAMSTNGLKFETQWVECHVYFQIANWDEGLQGQNCKLLGHFDPRLFYNKKANRNSASSLKCKGRDTEILGQASARELRYPLA